MGEGGKGKGRRPGKCSVVAVAGALGGGGGGLGGREQGAGGGRCRGAIVPEWLEHTILRPFDISAFKVGYREVAAELTTVISVALHDKEPIPAIPSDTDIQAAQHFEFKRLATWVTPATIDKLAVASRAGISKAVGQMVQSGEEMLVSAVKGDRAFTADEGRTVHRKLASTAKTRAQAAAQTFLIEVLTEHRAYPQWTEEDLCRLSDRLKLIDVTLRQGAPAWYDRAVTKADLAGRLQRSADEVGTALVQRASRVIAALKHTLDECSTLVEKLPNMHLRQDTYTKQCVESRKKMRGLIDALRRAAEQLCMMKEVVVNCRQDVTDDAKLIEHCHEACLMARLLTFAKIEAPLSEALSTAYMELLETCKRCALVLEGHLSMGDVLHVSLDLRERQWPANAAQQLRAARRDHLQRAEGVYSRLAQMFNVVVPPGMPEQLDKMRSLGPGGPIVSSMLAGACECLHVLACSVCIQPLAATRLER